MRMSLCDALSQDDSCCVYENNFQIIPTLENPPHWASHLLIILPKSDMRLPWALVEVALLCCQPSSQKTLSGLCLWKPPILGTCQQRSVSLLSHYQPCFAPVPPS